MSKYETVCKGARNVQAPQFEAGGRLQLDFGLLSHHTQTQATLFFYESVQVFQFGIRKLYFLIKAQGPHGLFWTQCGV